MSVSTQRSTKGVLRNLNRLTDALLEENSRLQYALNEARAQIESLHVRLELLRRDVAARDRYDGEVRDHVAAIIGDIQTHYKPLLQSSSHSFDPLSASPIRSALADIHAESEHHPSHPDTHHLSPPLSTDDNRPAHDASPLEHERAAEPQPEPTAEHTEEHPNEATPPPRTVVTVVRKTIKTRQAIVLTPRNAQHTSGSEHSAEHERPQQPLRAEEGSTHHIQDPNASAQEPAEPELARSADTDHELHTAQDRAELSQGEYIPEPSPIEHNEPHLNEQQPEPQQEHIEHDLQFSPEELPSEQDREAPRDLVDFEAIRSAPAMDKLFNLQNATDHEQHDEPLDAPQFPAVLVPEPHDGIDFEATRSTSTVNKPANRQNASDHEHDDEAADASRVSAVPIPETHDVIDFEATRSAPAVNKPTYLQNASDHEQYGEEADASPYSAVLVREPHNAIDFDATRSAPAMDKPANLQNISDQEQYDEAMDAPRFPAVLVPEPHDGVDFEAPRSTPAVEQPANLQNVSDHEQYDDDEAMDASRFSSVLVPEPRDAIDADVVRSTPAVEQPANLQNVSDHEQYDNDEAIDASQFSSVPVPEPRDAIDSEATPSTPAVVQPANLQNVSDHEQYDDEAMDASQFSAVPVPEPRDAIDSEATRSIPAVEKPANLQNVSDHEQYDNDEAMDVSRLSTVLVPEPSDVTQEQAELESAPLASLMDPPALTTHPTGDTDGIEHKPSVDYPKHIAEDDHAEESHQLPQDGSSPITRSSIPPRGMSEDSGDRYHSGDTSGHEEQDLEEHIARTGMRDEHHEEAPARQIADETRATNPYQSPQQPLSSSSPTRLTALFSLPFAADVRPKPEDTPHEVAKQLHEAGGLNLESSSSVFRVIRKKPRSPSATTESEDDDESSIEFVTLRPHTAEVLPWKAREGSEYIDVTNGALAVKPLAAVASRFGTACLNASLRIVEPMRMPACRKDFCYISPEYPDGTSLPYVPVNHVILQHQPPTWDKEETYGINKVRLSFQKHVFKEVEAIAIKAYQDRYPGANVNCVSRVTSTRVRKYVEIDEDAKVDVSSFFGKPMRLGVPEALSLIELDIVGLVLLYIGVDAKNNDGSEAELAFRLHSMVMKRVVSKKKPNM